VVYILQSLNTNHENKTCIKQEMTVPDEGQIPGTQQSQEFLGFNFCNKI
jgi:hypothetical protein